MTTHNTREGIEEIAWQDRFDAAIEAPNTDGGFIYDLGEDYQSVDFDTDAIKDFIHQELQQAREQRKGWKGYLVVDPETDNYTYSDVYLNRIDAEKWLKANGISGLKIIEVDVYQSELDQPITSNKTNGL